MKIAYLILAHNNIKHLNRLISKLDNGRNLFFIHLDKKNEKDINKIVKGKNIKIISQYDVKWGGFSIVQATIALISEASKSERCDFYSLLSGVDYPIISNSKIEEFLLSNIGANFINVVKMPVESKPISRVSKFYLEGAHRTSGLKTKILKISNCILKKIPYSRRLPIKYKEYQLYAGSQWWTFEQESDFVPLKDPRGF